LNISTAYPTVKPLHNWQANFSKTRFCNPGSFFAGRLN
jgi:hypothetical protein